ncbi:cytochrome P450 [Rhodococcus sp. NPDC058521]|uniref:cytochrome P450 n=1 Tax=Rhodococcus sp. NPDC058521 TaxID=3346536 RepID=UPI003664BEF9
MTHALDTVRVDLDEIAHITPPSMIEPLRKRSRGGLAQVKLPSGHTAVHLSTYRNVHAVLTDVSFVRAETNVDDGPTFLPTIMPTEMLLNLDHPDHGRLKGFVASAYSAATMTHRVPAVHKVLDGAVATLREQKSRGSADLVGALLDPVTIGVNVDYLGIPTSDIAHFRHLSREMQLAHDTDVDQLLSDFWTLYHYIEDLVARRRELRPGLVLDLLDARDSVTPPVTDAEYAAILLGSLVGGDQNVLSVITKIAYVALARPQLWEYLVGNPESIPSAVEEFLRVLPLGRISTFPRVTTREITLSGGVLHPGDIVYADAHSANRDPSEYPDPGVIDLSRTGKRHLQFGYGMHHCMGAAMARMEIVEVLRRLVTEFPSLELAVPDGEVPWETGVLVHRPVSIPVTW